METIKIETQPTADKNVSYVVGRVGNFDMIGINRGLSLWVEMFNANGGKFDAQYVQISGPDWTDWPAGLTDEEDYEYVSSIILKQLGLVKRRKSPYFVVYPNSQSVIEGANVDFYAEAKGNPDVFTYQWYFDSAEIVGATGNSFSVENVTPTNAGSYILSVTNEEGSISGSAYLEVLQKTAPHIINEPIDTSIISGQNGQLTVLANGTPNPTYQWYKDGAEISGAISTSLIFTNMQPENTGVYHSVATNSEGSATSNSVIVSILDAFSEPEEASVEENNI